MLRSAHSGSPAEQGHCHVLNVDCGESPGGKVQQLKPGKSWGLSAPGVLIGFSDFGVFFGKEGRSRRINCRELLT